MRFFLRYGAFNDMTFAYGEMVYTLFMSYMARDNILINIHQL